MPTANLNVNVRSVNDQISVLEIVGEVNAFAEEALMSGYQEASDKGATTLILDFNALDYMNSSGIGLLVTMLIRTQKKNQRLLAFGLTDHYRRIFELTRLDEAIGIYDTEAEAMAAVSGAVA